jgi:hypothetical protein
LLIIFVVYYFEKILPFLAILAQFFSIIDRSPYFFGRALFADFKYGRSLE